MKIKNLILMLLIIFAICGINTTTLAGGGFTTGVANDNSIKEAKPGDWAISPNDYGTRYVFRIDGKEIEREYYINHLYDNEKEKVFLGSGIDTVEYNFADPSELNRDTYFKYAANSTSANWKGKSEGEPRHIIVWGKYNDPDTKFYFDGFGLSDNSIKLLSDTIIKYANSRGDSSTVQLLQRVKNTIDGKDAEGGIKFEIRSEILMNYRVIGKSGKGNTSDNPFGVYVTYEQGKHQYLTYNELRALWYKLGGDSARRHFDRIAMQLYEDDEEYTIVNGHLNCSCNYAAKAGVLFTLQKGDNVGTCSAKYANYLQMNAEFSKFGLDGDNFLRRYIPGFCSIEAKYNGETVYPVLGVQYAKNNQEITVQYYLSDSAGKYSYNTANKYHDGNPASYKSIHNFSNCDNPVISEGWDYIYNSLEKHPIVVPDKTTVTINYKNEKTGGLITNLGFNNPDGPKDIDSNGYDRIDLSSKGYTYTGVSVDNSDPNKKDSKTHVTIPDDKKAHEITFWYIPEEVTKVKIIHELESGTPLTDPIEIVIRQGEKAGPFTELSKTFGPNYKCTGVEQLTPEKKDKDPNKTSVEEIGFEGDKTYEFIFWYKKQTEIRVIGVYNKNTIYTAQPYDTFDLPKENIVYKESSYQKYVKQGYTFSSEVERFDNKTTFPGRKNPELNSELKFSIDENAPQQILIVFYYKPEFTLKIKHIDEETGKSIIPNKEYYEVSLVPGETKKVNSYPIQGGEYINSKVILDGSNVTPSGVENTKGQYTVDVDYNGKNREIIFYYRKQKLVVSHLWIDGTTRKDPETLSLPTNPDPSRMKDYVYVGSRLNGGALKKDDTVHVDYNFNINGNQELIFYYDKPGMVVDPKKPQDEIGIIPSDLNNQLIGQLDNEYYWVLNEKGEITVRVAVKHVSEGTNSLTCKLKMPFDFYIDNNYHSAGEFNIGTLDLATVKPEGYEDYDIYEKKITNIYVPVWTNEKQHTVTATIDYIYTPSTAGSSSTSISDDATANVTVVGALYDFTITNLDGSDTTGDSMWKKSLFPTAKEYKAKDTAIGQGITGQQPSKYYQAIKRGTRFYFSVNTLGAANNQLEIVPRFYYVSADGKNIEEVIMKSNYMGNKRSINLNDTNRITAEFSKERAMKNTLDNGATSKAGTVFEVGNYSKLTLNRNVNTPYLGIVNDVKAKFAGKELTAILQGTAKTETALYQVANHWYADYSVPNDATFYKKNGTQVDENGCLVVYFSIITKNDANNEYLAYNLESPFVQSEKISEWNYERKDNTLTKEANYKLVLPKTSVNNASKNITTGDIWIEDTNKAGHTAVIIYSLKQNVSTRQNVTSAGTH